MVNNYTALYSPLDIEYNQIMSGRYGDLSVSDFWVNLSTRIIDEVTGICIAGLKDNKITGFWRPMVCFGNENFQRKQIKILYDICPDIYYQDYLISGSISVISRFLLAMGYKARPYFTQIIDLTKTKEELHADLRKSYKSLVCKYPVYNCTTKPIRGLHLKLRGKTRPDETWEIQERMILNNQAFVLASGKVGLLTMEANATAMIYYNKDWAYYACGASEIDSHHVIWSCILKAKELGCKWFEMGEQNFNGNEKEKNISIFKSGFGGKTICRLNLTKQ